MPIFEEGYRKFEGSRLGAAHRIGAIARQGIATEWKSTWVKRLMFVAWIPFLYYLGAFVMLAFVGNPEYRDFVDLFLGSIIGQDMVALLINNPGKVRPLIWSQIMFFFINYTQIFFVMIILAMVGPRLISKDIQHSGLQIYFSKPVGVREYLAGKFLVLFFYISMVTLIPALILYLVSLLVSTSGFFTVLSQTAFVVVPIFTSTILLTVVCGSIILLLSSMTKSGNYLGFAWIAIWMVSNICEEMVRGIVLSNVHNLEPEVQASEVAWTYMLSLWNNFHAVIYQLFGLEQYLNADYLSPRTHSMLQSLKFEHPWEQSLMILLGIAFVAGATLAYRMIKFKLE